MFDEECCRHCGESLKGNTIACPHCGKYIDDGNNPDLYNPDNNVIRDEFNIVYFIAGFFWFMSSDRHFVFFKSYAEKEFIKKCDFGQTRSFRYGQLACIGVIFVIIFAAAMMDLFK